MAKKKKSNKSKINIYWFYASIVFVIISIGLLGGDNGIQNTQPTDISSFESYLRNGDIDKVTIINQRYARITLNENALEKQRRQELPRCEAQLARRKENTLDSRDPQDMRHS